jgi:hypothetical protein
VGGFFLFRINNIDHVLERERTMKEKRGREEQRCLTIGLG